MATVHIVDDDAGSDCDKPRLLQAAGYDVVVYRSAEELPARLPELSEPVFLQPTLRDGGSSASSPANRSRICRDARSEWSRMQDRLKKQGLALPIVFVTGSEEPIEGAAKDLLIKPFSMDKLLEAIEDALRGERTAE